MEALRPTDRRAAGPSPRFWVEGDGREHVVVDESATAVADLDATDVVVTGCAWRMAETGTVVLDASSDQGRRAITLVVEPD